MDMDIPPDTRTSVHSPPYYPMFTHKIFLSGPKFEIWLVSSKLRPLFSGKT